MRLLTFAAMAGSLIASGAFAETTVIHRDDAPAVVEHRSTDANVEKKVITRDEGGCASTTVKKSDDRGDSVVEHRTNC